MEDNNNTEIYVVYMYLPHPFVTHHNTLALRPPSRKLHQHPYPILDLILCDSAAILFNSLFSKGGRMLVCRLVPLLVYAFPTHALSFMGHTCLYQHVCHIQHIRQYIYTLYAHIIFSAMHCNGSIMYIPLGLC